MYRRSTQTVAREEYLMMPFAVSNVLSLSLQGCWI